MNRKGFTLIELLVSIVVLAIVLVIGLCAARGTVAASLIGLNGVTDGQVYTAATNYVNEKNISFNGETSVCVYVKDLVNYGYLSGNVSNNMLNKIVMVSRNNTTKVVNEVKYVNECN